MEALNPVLPKGVVCMRNSRQQAVGSRQKSTRLFSAYRLLPTAYCPKKEHGRKTRSSLRVRLALTGTKLRQAAAAAGFAADVISETTRPAQGPGSSVRA